MTTAARHAGAFGAARAAAEALHDPYDWDAYKKGCRAAARWLRENENGGCSAGWFVGTPDWHVAHAAANYAVICCRMARGMNAE